MPKKPNYGFEKRKRENDRKIKQEQKLLRKREAAEQERLSAAPAVPAVSEISENSPPKTESGAG